MGRESAGERLSVLRYHVCLLLWEVKCVKHGYNWDGERLPQINLALLFGQVSQLPVYYNRIPGNINDVSTLHNILKTFNFLGSSKLHLVLDKGFYSQANVDELLKTRYKFTIAVPLRKWAQQIIDEVKETIQNPENYRKLDGEILYVHTKLYLGAKSIGDVMYICTTTLMRQLQQPTA